jgi:hypothetical protein
MEPIAVTHKDYHLFALAANDGTAVSIDLDAIVLMQSKRVDGSEKRWKVELILRGVSMTATLNLAEEACNSLHAAWRSRASNHYSKKPDSPGWASDAFDLSEAYVGERPDLADTSGAK